MKTRHLVFFIALLLALHCAKIAEADSTELKVTPSTGLDSSSFRAYYKGIDNSKTNDALKLELHNKIKGHKVIRYTEDSATRPTGYDWVAFGDIKAYLQNTDLPVNDRFDVWDYFIGIAVLDANPRSISCPAAKRVYDYYSGYCYIPAGTYSAGPNINAPALFGQGTGVSAQDQTAMNREHSWPKSWFLSATQVNNPATGDYCYNANSDAAYVNYYDFRALTDIHHLLPTESSANSTRSNNPFGIVNAVASSFTAAGAKAATPPTGGKSGTPHHTNITQGAYATCGAASDQVPCTATTVFEPPDHVKGDVARVYFYMATRYYQEDNCWLNVDAVNKANIKPWQEKMLRKWHNDDPVDAGEIAKNDLIERIQGNRNPFIDHPEWVAQISDF